MNDMVLFLTHEEAVKLKGLINDYFSDNCCDLEGNELTISVYLKLSDLVKKNESKEI